MNLAIKSTTMEFASADNPDETVDCVEAKIAERIKPVIPIGNEPAMKYERKPEPLPAGLTTLLIPLARFLELST